MVEEGDAQGDLWEAAKCVYVPPCIVISQMFPPFQLLFLDCSICHLRYAWLDTPGLCSTRGFALSE